MSHKTTEPFLYRPHPEGDTAPLLVVFSGINAEVFTFFKTTQHIPCSILYLRDTQLRTWYQEGVTKGGHINDVDEIIRRHQLPGQPLYCIGSSMGGYAALYYGIRLQARRVWSLSPQIVLRPGIPRCPTVGIVVDSLVPLLNQPGETEVDMVFGDNDLIDLFHAIQYDPATPGVRTVSVVGGAHNVAMQLNDGDQLKHRFSDFVAGRPLDYSPHPVRLIQDFDPRQVEVVREVVPAYYARDYAKAVETLLAYLEIAPDWAAGHDFLGLSAMHSPAHRHLAPDAAATAVRLDPKFKDFLFDAARISLEMDQVPAFLEYSNRLAVLHPDSPLCHRLALLAQAKGLATG